MDLILTAVLPMLAFMPSQSFYYDLNNSKSIIEIDTFYSMSPELEPTAGSPAYFYQVIYSVEKSSIEIITNQQNPNSFMFRANLALVMDLYQSPDYSQHGAIDWGEIPIKTYTRDLLIEHTFNSKVNWEQLSFIDFSVQSVASSILMTEQSTGWEYQNQTNVSYAIYFSNGSVENFWGSHNYGYQIGTPIELTQPNSFRANRLADTFRLNLSPLIEEAIEAGDKAGYDEGYEKGYADGISNENPFMKFFKSMVGVVDGCLQIEVFPGFKLWYFVGIPLIFTAVLFVFKLFR